MDRRSFLAIGVATGAAWAFERDATAAAPAEWTEWRGPRRDAVSAETGLQKEWKAGGPTMLWKASGLGGGYSTPSFSQGMLFGMGYRGEDEVIWARDVETGAQKWVTPAIATANRGVGYAEGSRSTPTVVGDRLYSLGVSGDLVCLDTQTGRLHWRKNLITDFGGRLPNWGFTESPLVDGDKVLVTPGGRGSLIVALNRMTGETIWQSNVPGNDQASYSSIVIGTLAGRRQYVQFVTGGVVGVGMGGEFLWRHNRPQNGIQITTPVLHNDHVFVTTAYDKGGALVKVTADGGAISAQEVYFSQEMQNHHGGVIRIGENIYYAEGHRGSTSLVCREFLTGKLVWRSEERLKGSLFFAEGNFYFRNERGEAMLFEANPAAFVVKGRFDPPDRSGKNAWAHPVVVGGRLYLRDQDWLHCYDVRA